MITVETSESIPDDATTKSIKDRIMINNSIPVAVKFTRTQICQKVCKEIQNTDDEKNIAYWK